MTQICVVGLCELFMSLFYDANLRSVFMWTFSVAMHSLLGKIFVLSFADDVLAAVEHGAFAVVEGCCLIVRPSWMATDPLLWQELSLSWMATFPRSFAGPFLCLHEANPNVGGYIYWFICCFCWKSDCCLTAASPKRNLYIQRFLLLRLLIKLLVGFSLAGN